MKKVFLLLALLAVMAYSNSQTGFMTAHNTGGYLQYGEGFLLYAPGLGGPGYNFIIYQKANPALYDQVKRTLEMHTLTFGQGPYINTNSGVVNPSTQYEVAIEYGDVNLGARDGANLRQLISVKIRIHD
ncbi:MAG: hypothetical protein J0L75_08245 [Spirochaetes bacterium]|nr:hypothetical protein [Spirochaetota bacterium]